MEGGKSAQSDNGKAPTLKSVMRSSHSISPYMYASEKPKSLMVHIRTHAESLTTRSSAFNSGIGFAFAAPEPGVGKMYV